MLAMFYGNGCNNGNILWVLIVIILLFGGGWSGYGCCGSSCGCGDNCGCGNNCGCGSNCGCGC